MSEDGEIIKNADHKQMRELVAEVTNAVIKSSGLSADQLISAGVSVEYDLMMDRVGIGFDPPEGIQEDDIRKLMTAIKAVYEDKSLQHKVIIDEVPGTLRAKYWAGIDKTTYDFG